MEFEKLLRQILYSLLSIWAILLPPSILLAMLTVIGMTNLSGIDPIAYQILYVNSILFPLMICVSLVGNFFSIRASKYFEAFVFAALPFINIFIELVAADLALLLV